MLSPSSESKNNPNKKNLPAAYFYAGFFLGLLCYPEDAGDMFLRNVD
jgi:hypothetical protein